VTVGERNIVWDLEKGYIEVQLTIAKRKESIVKIRGQERERETKIERLWE